MPDSIIRPLDCPYCPLGEIRRGFVYCRHYKLSYMIDHDERPKYCLVERITIEEGEENP